MEKGEENKQQQNLTTDSGDSQSITDKTKRRAIFKALAGIPVLGALGYGIIKERSYERKNEKAVLKKLGLEDIRVPQVVKHGKGDLIRIGMIGFGSRGGQLARSLGFMHPSDAERRQKQGTLDDWLMQEDLNVAVTGICDVFDLHAQQGIETASNELRTGNNISSRLPVKRYRNYREMLADKDIDAVIIATPDHHHALMSVEATKAGKHVYCEKSPALSEESLNELYKTVKNSNIVFQLGHQITKNGAFQQAQEIVKKNVLGKITLIETTTNRNSANGAWIRHLDSEGNPKPGDEKTIDWEQWLGPAPKVPFSIDRYYNWTQWFDYDMGMFGQLFTHEYDAVNQLLNIGIPASVVASGGIYYWKDNRDMPDLLHAVFEYPEHELTLLYSATLSSSRSRGRVFMGHDASMELGDSVHVTADPGSTKYKKMIKDGTISTSAPMISINPGSGEIDAVTSATEKYYASRGLTTTFVNGRRVDVTHLHLKEWLDCIRFGGTPSCNIERTFEEGITVLMGHKAYLEGRKVLWDPVNRKIV